MELPEMAKTVIGLLAIVNPLAAIPVFLSITANSSDEDRTRIARTTATSVIIILAVSTAVGGLLLAAFGIQIPAFRIAGGILIARMALAMMQARPSAARHTGEERAEAEEKQSIAVVPLAIPILAGPGAISSVIIAAEQAKGWLDYLPIGASIFLTGTLVYWALRLASPLQSRLGRTGFNVLTRIFGLIVLALAIEFIAGGIREMWMKP